MSPAGEPLRGDFLASVLQSVLLTFMTAAMAVLYTWHSFRIGLACALRAVKAPNWVILALCRWRSEESLNTYARVNRTCSAQWLDEVAFQSIDSVQAPNVGRISRFPPQMLPDEVTSFIAKAVLSAESLSPESMRDLVSTLPEVDDDRYMQELANLHPEGVGETQFAGASEDDW
jgi:hypothetical protein